MSALLDNCPVFQRWVNVIVRIESREGRKNGSFLATISVVPERDLMLYVSEDPALKRWAIFRIGREFDLGCAQRDRRYRERHPG